LKWRCKELNPEPLESVIIMFYQLN
jgi:hypothetical protein